MAVNYFLQFLITIYLVVICKNQEFDLDPCYSNPCAPGAVCISTNSANYSCSCRSGFSGDGFTNCTDVCNPNPCQSKYLTCHATDSVSENYICTCDSPNFNTTDGRCCHDFCRLDNNDGTSLLNLSFNDKSHASPNCTSYCTYATLTCPPNYINYQNPPSCIEFDVCYPHNPCGHGHCTKVASKYKCDCFPGFIFDDDRHCVDENECEIKSPCSNSPNGTICTNTIGGYTCSCDPQTSIAVLGNNSIPTCIATDRCYQNDSSCDQNCKNSLNGSVCSCVDGYKWDDTSCIFDDNSSYVTCNRSCSESDDIQAGICLNKTCTCFSGYKLKNGKCAPEYTCDDISDTCYFGFNCTNILSRPGYTCNCDNIQFVTGPDGRCYDYDECLSNEHECDSNAVCFNRDGGYECKCNAGFQGNGYNCTELPSVCDDIEVRQTCASMGKICRQKAPGVPECYCPIPFSLVGDEVHGRICVPPTYSIFIYHLSLPISGWTGNNSFNTLRRLEYEFLKNFFPYVTVAQVLNIEVINVTSTDNENTQVDMHILFSCDVSYLNTKLEEICSDYPYINDTCILPENVLIRKSKEIKFADVTNSTVCSNSNLVCGSDSICEVLNHNYQCKCDDYHIPEGYVNSRRPICVDRNECLENPDICGSPSQMCVNHDGNYTCQCLPCYIWDDTYKNCLFVCQNNPCQNNGYCSSIVYGDVCSYGCTCSETFFGPNCEYANQAVHVARNDEAIIGGVLGGLLAVMIGISLFLVYKIYKWKGYLSLMKCRAWYKTPELSKTDADNSKTQKWM